MFVPRVMFALGRDGMFLSSATTVNKGGTPVFALAFTAIPAIVLAAIGTFEKLLAISEPGQPFCQAREWIVGKGARGIVLVSLGGSGIYMKCQ